MQVNPAITTNVIGYHGPLTNGNSINKKVRVAVAVINVLAFDAIQLSDFEFLRLSNRPAMRFLIHTATLAGPVKKPNKVISSIIAIAILSSRIRSLIYML